MTSSRNYIDRVISDFHERFYPEVIVSYIGQGDNGKLAFKFEGHFCLTCGLHDYFDDFVDILSQHLGDRYAVFDKLELDEGYSGWIVVFAPAKMIKEKSNEKLKFIVLDPKKGKILERYNL